MTHHTAPKHLSPDVQLSPLDADTGLDERLYQVLDRTVAFAAFLSSEGLVKHVSSNALEAAGLAQVDVVGQPFWETYWWSHDPEAQVRLQKAISDAQTGQTSRYGAVIRIINDGRLHIAFQLSPLVDRDGRVAELIASAFDVSDRVASQQRLEQLVREMSHRIKNLLTTVMAMARMTQRASKPEMAFREFTARLEALNAAHDALNDASTAEAFFEFLARRLLRPYKTFRASRVAISGPGIRLAPSEAKMLALCLYELATNATKYGALSNSEGRVAVCLTGPDQEGHSTFTWTERGGPPVVSPSRQGYGTKFITTTLQGLFGGEVSMNYAPEGLCLTVSGPASGLFAPLDDRPDVQPNVQPKP